MYRDCKD